MTFLINLKLTDKSTFMSFELFKNVYVLFPILDYSQSSTDYGFITIIKPINYKFNVYLKKCNKHTQTFKYKYA